MNLYGKDAIISSSVPISYTFRRLKDNTKVEIVNNYEEIRKELQQFMHQCLNFSFNTFRGIEAKCFNKEYLFCYKVNIRITIQL